MGNFYNLNQFFVFENWHHGKEKNKNGRFSYFGRMLSFIFLSIIFLSTFSTQGQTTLVNPAAEGGFELGSTFAANGWTTVNPSTDTWQVGAVPVVASGTNCAFVSADGGVAWSYSQVSVFNHLYRDVTIPPGESKITLTFKWRVGGEGSGTSDWDNLKVFLGSTSITPVSTAAITGATQLSGPGAINGMYKLSSLAWNTETISFSAAPGTYRLFFSWKSDITDIVNPPAALDDISLTSAVPGNFISIATGDWNNPTTWDANAVPTPADNAVVSVGHVVTVNAASLGVDDLTVNGTLNYGTTPTTFNVNGNLTVNAGGIVNVFNGTTGKTLVVSENIVNDGLIDVSIGTTTAGNLTLNGSTVQSVSGSGNFGASNVIRNLTFSNTNTATPNINWLVNNIKIANNLNLTGARINLGSNKITFGNTAAGGTLTAPVGTGFLPGGKFSRWWTATATGTAITAGTDPTNATSRYPFLSATGLNRAMYISRTNATGAVAGELAVVYTDATTVTTGLTVVDGSYTVTDRFDGNWSVTNEGTLVSASSYTLAIVAPSAYSIGTGNSRILFANAPLSGAHQNGTNTPGAQRVTVSQADLLGGPLYLGFNTDDVPNVSLVSGNWDNPSIWSKGTVPSCTNSVTIGAGTTVTVNSSGNNARNVTILANGELQVVSGDLTVGCTLNNNPFANNGTLNVTGGTLNINGQLLSNANSTFNQSAGQINVDGNNGGDATTSVPSATSIVQLNTNLLNWTGGTLTVVDPHANTTASNSFAYTSTLNVDSGVGHTFRIGNGVSTDVGGNATNGFRLNTWVSSGRITFGNLILNGGNGTNRFVSTTYSFGINNNFTIESNSTYRGSQITYLAGNLVNNGTYVNTSTLYLGAFLGGVAGPSSNAQTVSGTGVFDNALTAPTANLVSMSVNNSNASGVTLSVPLRVSGTLTLVSGIVNTSATSVLSLGTSTYSAAGTLSGTPSATTYISGPFERVIANTNTAFIQFPIGKAGYTPIWLAPTTTAASSFRAEAFNSNAGTLATSLQNMSANRWETSLVGGSFTAINARLGDSSLVTGRLLVQAPTSAGLYDSAFGTTATFVAGTPNTIESTAPVTSANYTGFISHAELCTTPAPTGDAAQDFCNETLADLTVTGTGIVWYDAATLGNILPSTTVLVTGTTYYASQTLNGCPSITRLAVTVTENCPIIGCLTAPNGQWPSGPAGYTPTTCDGLFINSIVTNGWAGEYSLVNVVTGQTYTFTSSVGTDFITISDAAGTTALAIGTGSATWVSTLTGQIRFYTHLNAACGDAQINRTRSIVCGVLSTDAPDYVSLQWPPTINVAQGGSGTVFGQVYEAGLTDVVPNIVGQAPGIQAWIGISPVGQNTNPNTWTTWVPATWNSGSVGNNDEYQATIGATLLPGTYYYATRFRLNTGPYVYGGIDGSNNGNFWNGTTHLSGVLTITPPPAPANDECAGALSVTVNPALVCTSVTAGTLIGATASTVDALACGGTEDDDVWFSFVATAATHRISLNDITGSTTDLYHSVWTGADCNSLTLVPGSCSDPNISNPTGLVIGQTYYIRVYSWTATGGQTSAFNVCIGTLPPPPANDECAGALTLTVNADYLCGVKTAGTLQSATASAVDPLACGGTEDDDVWFSFIATATTHRVSLIDITGGTTDLFHSLWTGADCNSLTLVPGSCSDPNISNPTGLVIGQTYYVRVYSWTATPGQSSVFNVCIGTDPCIASVSAPTGDAAQAFCNAATVANLVATGTAIKWYSVPVGGTALLATDALVNGQMYYASQTIVCEGSARLAVTVTINTTAAPTGDAAQDFCNETLADLTVTGTGIIWYDAATLGTVLPSTTVLVTGSTYYASQTLNGCESLTRLAVTVTENCPIIGCLTAPNGQWPSGTAGFTPATCDGLTVNVIVTNGFAGEYSRVNVVTGQTYTFTSSVATDFITISDIGGTTAFAIGTGSATWVSNLTGQIRFYTHLSIACGSDTVNRTRSIVCGVLSTDAPDYVSLQWPPTINVVQGGSGTVFGQVYEAGLTDVVPNIVGQAPGIQAWVGISPVGQNTNPNTWTTWVPATWNSGSVGNNDEYQATIGAALPPGTYYYATRFRLNTGPFVYGGIDASNNGNFWNGTTHLSGVLTITPPPAPANDLCTSALPLTVGVNFAANVTSGTIFGATTTAGLLPSCQANAGFEVWYTVVVPASGNLTVETQQSATDSMTDSVVTVYTGTCGTLTQVGCDDDAGLGNMSLVNVTGLTPGATVYVAVWKWSTTAPTATTGGFQVSAYDPDLSSSVFDEANFNYYPNPVTDILNVSYSDMISTVEVFNMVGQQVVTKKLNATNGQIDMSQLPSGTYVIKVSTEEASKVIKVIKR